MGTLLIPGMVTFVPQFVLAANAGLVDTLPGLFLPFLVAPFGVFLMRQYIKGLPRDLLDAGRVDGAGELRIFCADHPAALRSCPGDAGDPDVPRQLEQLPVAAGRRPDRGHLHPAGRPRALLQGPERHELRPAPRRGHRGRHAHPADLPRLPAQVHRGHRHHRHQVATPGTGRRPPRRPVHPTNERPTMSDQTMPDPIVPTSSNRAPRVPRGLATPDRRHVIVGGAAMLAALGLSPHAEASAPTASLPDAVPGASNSRLHALGTRHLAQPGRVDAPGHRPAGRQHPRVAGRG